MKDYKLSFCAIIAMAGLFMGSCSDDFTNWAQPQTYAQEDAVTIPGFTATAVAPQDLATVGDSVPAFTLSSAVLPEGYSLANARVELVPVGVSGATASTISTSLTGKMLTEDLQKVIVDNFGMRPINRTFDAHVYINAVKDGQAALIDAGTVQVVAAPNAPFIDDYYYLVGNVNGNEANRNNALQTFKVENGGIDAYANPVFGITLTAAQVGTGLEFKLIPQSTSGSWDKAMTADDTAPTSQMARDNSGGFLKVTPVAGAKYYKLVFNMMDLSWSVTSISDPELFLTGSNYSWGGTWKPLTIVNGSPDNFWTIIYLNANEEFKFAPQAAWGGDFGYDGTVNDIAGAGATNSGGNIKIANAGWYLLHVINGVQRVVNILPPHVYLIGNTAGAWTVSAANRFTIPTTATGDFVSPAFVASDEVRMCVSLDATDWWRTEFIVTAAGLVEYRGNGGDQARVSVTAGQKAYINFANGTGSYQ